ncbi:MAG: ABC transporter permease [Ardenticatenales bacterium]|nr:ABC transporter permease [Ardenticatenales bacterium]
MKNKRQPPSHWRLIGLIFRKDMRQLWATLDLWRVLLLPAGLTLLFRLLWAGIWQERPLQLAVYAPDRPAWLAELAAEADLELIWLPEADAVRREATDYDGGLLLPAGSDTAWQANAPFTIEVFLPPDQGVAARLQALLLTTGWQQSSSKGALPFIWRAASDSAQPERFGPGLLFLLFGLLALLMPGLLLASNLVQAEKEAGMFANLLRTPLRPWHVLLGKGGVAALVALFAWLLVYLAAPGWQGQVGLVWLGTFLALPFIVGLGLWLGLHWKPHENRQARTPLIMVALMLPAIVWVFPNRPVWLTASLPLLPTHHLIQVWVQALSGYPDWPASLIHLGALLLAAGLILVLLRRHNDF